MSINSPLMWLQGGVGDQGMQSLNFQGFGVTPWVQPRLDASMPGLQPDLYQAMAAAALQEMRAVDASKCSSQSLLPFQQSQNVSNGPSALIQRQMLPQSQSQSTFLHSFQENQAPAQAQLLQQQMQRYHPYSDQRQQQHQQQQQPQLQQSKQLHQLSVQQHIPNVISSLSNFASVTQSQSPSLQAIPSQCQQQTFPDSVTNPISSSDVSPMHSILGSLSQDGGSHLLNLNGSNSVISSSSLLSKQITVEPQLPSGTIRCVMSQVEQLGTPQSSNVSELTSLPPFPGREYSAYQGATDPQSNLLFGVNIDSSSLMLQSGMSSLRNIGSENDSLSMPFGSSNYSSAAGTDFLNSEMTTSSCVDESGFLQSSENVDQVNPPTRTFVKVTGFKCFLPFFYLFILIILFNKW